MSGAVSLGLLLAFFPALSLGACVAVVAGGALLGTLAEAVAKRVDDNVMVPLAAAAGAALVAMLVGVGI